MWARRMAALTGDSTYGDVLEQVIYNTGLSGMSIDGTHFCYTNPLRWYGPEHRLLSQDAHERWFTARCYCCPPQVARTVAKMHRWAYGLSEEAVWVHIYGGSRLQAEVAGGQLVLEQERIQAELHHPYRDRHSHQNFLTAYQLISMDKAV